MLPNLGIPELILILVVALIIFGPGKLPEVGKSLGKTIREFRKSSSAIYDDDDSKIKDAEEVKEIKAAPKEIASKVEYHTDDEEEQKAETARG